MSDFDVDKVVVRSLVEAYYALQVERGVFFRVRRELADAHVAWSNMLSKCMHKAVPNLSRWENTKFMHEVFLGVCPGEDAGAWFFSRDYMEQGENWEQHVTRAVVDRFSLDPAQGEAVLEFFTEEEFFDVPQSTFLRDTQVQNVLMHLDAWLIFDPEALLRYNCAEPVPSLSWDRSNAPGYILLGMYAELINIYAAGKCQNATPAFLLEEMLREALEYDSEKETVRISRTDPDLDRIVRPFLPKPGASAPTEKVFETNQWKHVIKGPYTLSIETPEDGVTILTIVATGNK